MGDARAFQHLAQHLGFLNRNGAHENRLSFLVKSGDFPCRSLEFFSFRLVYGIGVILADHFFVGRYHHHIQLVDIVELGRFRIGCPRHTGKFFIHPEEILECDGGQCLVFLSHTDPFLCLHCLMETVAPPSSRHHPPCKFIHDHDLIILDDILDIFFKKPVGLDQLLGGMEKIGGPNKTVFQLLQTLIFLLIIDRLIFADEMAFIVQIRQKKISQTTA